MSESDFSCSFYVSRFPGFEHHGGDLLIRHVLPRVWPTWTADAEIRIAKLGVLDIIRQAVHVVLAFIVIVTAIGGG
jgi:hypothetical protein